MSEHAPTAPVPFASDGPIEVPRRAVADRSLDWPLVTVFCSSVALLYAVAIWMIVLLLGALL